MRPVIMTLTMASLLAPAAAVSAAPEPEGKKTIIDYEIQAGDTCTKVSKKFFGSSRRYDLIHSHNPNMGPSPHHLKAGDILKIPRYSAGPDAEVTATHRDVQARDGSKEAWDSAATGLDLFKGWRVNTLKKSAAEVTFRDQSQIQMRENTLIIIYGAQRTKVRLGRTEATLERGTLRTRLGELSGKPSKVKITMPGGDAELEGGAAVVGVDQEGTTRLSNHGGGKPATVRGKDGGSVKVKPLFGSKVKKGERPSKPKPLPPTPSWGSGGPGTFAGVPGVTSTVFGSWEPVEKAASYYVEVARDAEGRDVVAAILVPAKVTRFEAHGLPAGTYHVSVAAVDDDKFESPPSARQPLEIVAASLTGPGGTLPTFPVGAGGDKSAVAEPVVLPGATVAAPAGQRCGVAGAEPAASFVLVEPGPTEVTCVKEDGTAVPGFRVVVAAVKTAGSDGAPSLALTDGETSTSSLKLDSDVELPTTLFADAPAGVEVKEIRSTGPNAWDVSVVATSAAPERGVVSLFLDESKQAKIAELPFERAAAPAPVLAPKRDLHLLEFSLAGGPAMFSKNHELFALDREHQRLAPVAGIVSLRAAYHPIRVVGVEVEGSVLPAKVADGTRAVGWHVGGHVVGQLPYRVTPFLLAGGGVLGLRSASLGNDTDAAFHFGGGLKFYATQSVALRFDVRDMVGPRRGEGFAHHVVITGGVSIALRRSSPN